MVITRVSVYLSYKGSPFKMLCVHDRKKFQLNLVIALRNDQGVGFIPFAAF